MYKCCSHCIRIQLTWNGNYKIKIYSIETIPFVSKLTYTFERPTWPKIHHRSNPRNWNKFHVLKWKCVCVDFDRNSISSHYLLFAHNFIARRANRKFSIFGTSRNISSVTRQPFKLRTHFGSKFLSNESSRKSKSSGISLRFNLAKSKSISIPSKFILITGTNASSTACGKIFKR